MARTPTVFVLTGPREGKDFAPRSIPGVVFEKGRFEADIDVDKVPALARVLATYGAYPETTIPEHLKPGKTKEKTDAKQDDSSAGKAGETTQKSPAAKPKTPKSATKPKGQGTPGTDGNGQAGTSDLI